MLGGFPPPKKKFTPKRQIWPSFCHNLPLWKSHLVIFQSFQKSCHGSGLAIFSWNFGTFVADFRLYLKLWSRRSSISTENFFSSPLLTKPPPHGLSLHLGRKWKLNFNHVLYIIYILYTNPGLISGGGECRRVEGLANGKRTSSFLNRRYDLFIDIHEHLFSKQNRL